MLRQTLVARSASLSSASLSAPISPSARLTFFDRRRNARSLASRLESAAPPYSTLLSLSLSPLHSLSYSFSLTLFNSIPRMSRDLRPASSRFTARSFYLFFSPSRVLRPYVPRGETIRYRGVASAMVAVTATVAGCASKEKMPLIEVLRLYREKE